MIYRYPFIQQDYDTIQPGDTVLYPDGRSGICTRIDEPKVFPSILGDIQQGRSVTIRVIGIPDRNPSPIDPALPKNLSGLASDPGLSAPASASALPPVVIDASVNE